MTEPQAKSSEFAADCRFGVRRRVWPITVTSLALLASLIGASARGALAVNFTSTSDSFHVYTDQLIGNDIALFAGPQQSASGPVGQAHLILKNTTVDGLCIVATQQLPMGTVSAVITGGKKLDGNPAGVNQIKLDKIMVAVDSIKGDGKDAKNLTLGQSAETLTSGDTPWPGPTGQLGVALSRLTLDGMDISGRGMQVDSGLVLQDLAIKTTMSAATRADCS